MGLSTVGLKGKYEAMECWFQAPSDECVDTLKCESLEKPRFH